MLTRDVSSLLLIVRASASKQFSCLFLFLPVATLCLASSLHVPIIKASNLCVKSSPKKHNSVGREKAEHKNMANTVPLEPNGIVLELQLYEFAPSQKIPDSGSESN